MKVKINKILILISTLMVGSVLILNKSWAAQSPYPQPCDLKSYLENPHISAEILPSTYTLIDLTTLPYEAFKEHAGIEFFELDFKKGWK